MTVVRDDGTVAFVLFREGLRERFERTRTRRFYRQFVPLGGLCFDVGANMGGRSEIFLSLGARVVAVEPQELCQRSLRARFGDQIELVDAALGPEDGEAELLVASYHTLSSLSREWTDAVGASGRFAEFDWNEREHVRVTTLDALIDKYGIPGLLQGGCRRVRVRGSRGLTRGLPALSFEFTIERLDSRLAAVKRLAGLECGPLTHSPEESMRLALNRWVDLDGIKRYLAMHRIRRRHLATSTLAQPTDVGRSSPDRMSSIARNANAISWWEADTELKSISSGTIRSPRRNRSFRSFSP